MEIVKTKWETRVALKSVGVHADVWNKNKKCRVRTRTKMNTNDKKFLSYLHVECFGWTEGEKNVRPRKAVKEVKT